MLVAFTPVNAAQARQHLTNDERETVQMFKKNVASVCFIVSLQNRWEMMLFASSSASNFGAQVPLSQSLLDLHPYCLGRSGKHQGSVCCSINSAGCSAGVTRTPLTSWRFPKGQARASFLTRAALFSPTGMSSRELLTSRWVP